MVALGALMSCVAVGAMFSLAVFLQPMTADTGWSRAGISAAMTLNFLAMGVAGFGWGALSDRYGVKRILVAGLMVQAFAAVAFVFARRLDEFYAVAAVFGFAYGGVMPLYAVLALGVGAVAIALAFPPFARRAAPVTA
jgi:MFS family permease